MTDLGERVEETPVTVPARDLTPLFEPQSIAVVGASNDPGKWGHWIARGALQGRDRRDVFLVNRSGGSIVGEPAFTSLEELPSSPEMVVLVVPAASFGDALNSALAVGARGVVAISAGFAEAGDDGRSRQDEMVAKVREAGAVLVGPNCLGLVDTTSNLQVAWLLEPGWELPPGPIGMISQSGNLALDVAEMSEKVGLGISRFASLGNQADVSLTDVVRSYIEHDGTGVIAVYAEDFLDGRGFLDAADEARRAGKRVILLAAGASAAAARAARSHTGSMTSNSMIVDAACAAAGAIRVQTPKEIVDASQVALRSPRFPGRRLGIVSDGGGHAVISADVAEAAGFEVPAFSEGLRDRLLTVTNSTAGLTNPVDLASANTVPEGYERVVTAICESGEVDGVMMVGSFGGLGMMDDALREKESASAVRIAEAVHAAGVGLLNQTMVPHTQSAQLLRDLGAPTFRDVESAVRAGVLVAAQDPIGMPAAVEPPPSGEATGYFGARGLLETAGIEFAKAVKVTSAEEAIAAAESTGYPVVLKAIDLLHKSDAGGVMLGLETSDELRAAVESMIANVSPGPFSVEQMVAQRGVELVIGCRRDARFGPVLLIGFGGTYTEILRDTALALAPVSAEQAELLIRRLRGAPILLGARGAEPLAIGKAAEAAGALSQVAASRPDIDEIEINPLLVSRDSAIGLDARALIVDMGKEGSIA
jgi:acyl-CoA synthetase (NDP forming)